MQNSTRSIQLKRVLKAEAELIQSKTVRVLEIECITKRAALAVKAQLQEAQLLAVTTSELAVISDAADAINTTQSTEALRRIVVVLFVVVLLIGYKAISASSEAISQQ